MHKTILGKDGSPTHSNESKSPKGSTTKLNFQDTNMSGSGVFGKTGIKIGKNGQ